MSQYDNTGKASSLHTNTFGRSSITNETAVTNSNPVSAASSSNQNRVLQISGHFSLLTDRQVRLLRLTPKDQRRNRFLYRKEADDMGEDSIEYEKRGRGASYAWRTKICNWYQLSISPVQRKLGKTKKHDEFTNAQIRRQNKGYQRT